MIKTDLQLLRKRRTKIVATLGPASVDLNTIRSLISNGVDVFRMNMSHGDQAGHAAVYRKVREAADAYGKPVAIMADLCGPKSGRFPGRGIEFIAGAKVVVTVRDVPDEPGLISSQYSALAKDLRPETRCFACGRSHETKSRAHRRY